jgi:SRSO17 transposase
MGRRSGSAGWARSICPAKKSGSSVSIARQENANITSPTFPPTHRSKQLAGAIKARWVCEQAHQQLKEELGLDHFEGRSWTGLHRHALMTMIAYTFLQSRRLKQARREKKNRRTTTSPHSPSDPNRHHRRLRSFATAPMPALQESTWKAQSRLTARFRAFAARGKKLTVTCTAIARELAGFMWAVAREAQPV